MGGQKSFLEKVFSYIEQNRMIPSGGAVLAGVSGGADSVGLLMALTKYREHLAACRKPPFALRAVHVEHGLRGEAALQDAAFVKQLCKEQGIPCCIVHADVSGRAKAEGLSLEEAGRLERYRIFEEISEGEERIAVAHQMEDQAETVLFHLARGSALAGIGGMRPVRRRIIRPLLGVSREEIEKYLRREGISWRTDDTNLSTDYTRNRIRHEILPLLSSRVNAQSVLHICEAAEHAARTTDYLQEQADVFLAQSARREGDSFCLDAYALREEHPLIRTYVLREAIRRLGDGKGLKDVGAVHLNDMEKLLWKGSGKRLDLPGRLKCVRKGRQMILFFEENADSVSASREIPQPGNLGGRKI